MQEYIVFGKTFDKNQLLHFADFSVTLALLFTIPILLQHQLVVGVIVNAILIRTAIRHDLKHLIPAAIVPSIGALISGLLLKNLTSYLLLMLPFIWIGNFLIAFTVHAIYVRQKKNFVFSALFSSSVKTIFLFLSAFILFTFSFVPEAFLTVFGIFQLVTALLGSILAYVSIKLEDKLSLEKKK